MMLRMTNAYQLPTKDRIEAFAASAVVWLVRHLDLLLAPDAAQRRRLLHRLVLRLERTVECIIFLKAAARSVPPARRSRPPRSTPSGFRRTRGGARLLWKSARIRARKATMIARVTRLLQVLADGERYVVHFMKRLARGLCFGRLVACNPSAIALIAGAPSPARLADSS
jgi:hypothetical protein